MRNESLCLRTLPEKFVKLKSKKRNIKKKKVTEYPRFTGQLQQIYRINIMKTPEEVEREKRTEAKLKQ